MFGIRQNDVAILEMKLPSLQNSPVSQLFDSKAGTDKQFLTISLSVSSENLNAHDLRYKFLHLDLLAMLLTDNPSDSAHWWLESLLLS